MRGLLAAAAGVAALTGCGGVLAASVPTSASATLDRLVGVAARQYARETGGAVARHDLELIARDPGVAGALRSGSDAVLRSYVQRRFASAWYHQHVSRVQILRGSHVIVDVGVPFVVDGPQTVLSAGSGRSPLTLRISIQDEVGFVRLLHRRHPVEVVVRGRAPGDVRTSLPAALHVRLPDRGTTTIAGRRYVVRSLSRTSLGGVPVTIWLLVRG